MGLFDIPARAPGECIINIGSGEITDLYPFLIEVAVDTSRLEFTEAVLKFETRRDVDGTWIIHDDPRIRPWAPILIEAAFGDTTEEVMRGYIRQIDVEFPEEPGSATVTVTVQDDSLLLDRLHRTDTWGEEGARVSDADILERMLFEVNRSLANGVSDGQSDLILEQDETDASFLKKRAEANGYEYYFREGELYFGPRRLALTPQDPIMVYAGPSTNALSFSVKDDGHQPDGARFDIAAEEGEENAGEDLRPDLPLLGPEAASSVEQVDDRFVWRIQREGDTTEDSARARAQAKVNDASFKVKATGAVDGARYGHVMLVGKPVYVDGVGDRHAGKWYVDVVNHRFDLSGYRQEFEISRNAYGDNVPPGIGPNAGPLGGL
ncbi:MAG: hypothetical protein AAFN17_13690 [Pseudomonadota bacterium]